MSRARIRGPRCAALLALLALCSSACDGPRLPRFARPLPDGVAADGGDPDADAGAAAGAVTADH